MPIYLYRCGECEQTCEALQHTSDEPLLECPHCHAKALHKIIAPCGIIFKGHGFYKTDNPSGSSSEISHDSHSAHETPPSSSGSDAADSVKKTAESDPAPSASSASASPKPAEPAGGASPSAKEKG